jgi:hypothetical protein
VIGKKYSVEIKGRVTYLDEGNRRVAAPPGTYEMTELKGLVFEVSRSGGPTFKLNEREVAHYLQREMKIPGGWP